MNLTWKRNYKIVLLFIGVIVFGVVFGGTRNMSYNFGEYSTEYQWEEKSYTGSIEPMDDSLVHSISIDITSEQYEYILRSYELNREKEYVPVNVTIDGTTIQNVWLRLKWNIDLVTLLQSTQGESLAFTPSSYILKFDKYISGQNYQWYSELALRVDNENSNIWQILSSQLAQSLGLYAPDMVFTTLSFWDYGTYFYLLSEEINQEYIDANFLDTAWVLFEAENELSFHYLGEDPVLYLELFDQETQIHKEDSSSIIKLLHFVTQSSDEEFAQDIEQYIDIKNYAGYLAMNTVLGDDDMLLWLLNNYYIYFDSEGIAHFILWDQKISFGSISTSLEEVITKYYGVEDISELDIENLESLISFSRQWVQWEDIGEGQGIYLNDLKDKFLKNEEFRELYEQKIQEFSSVVFWGTAQEYLDKLYNTFTQANIDEDVLSLWVFGSDYASYWNVLQNMKSW